MKEKTLFKEIRFNHYFDYEELTSALERIASDNSSIAKLRSIGKTPENRELWLMEITNFERSPAEGKPAIWIDGNIHAGEVLGSMICLKTIWRLLKSYKSNVTMTRLIDENTFYILPRVDPDGGEFCIKTPYYVLGGENETGGGRWYPLSKERWTRGESGLYMEDINGDGYITSMRIKDPNGDWKKSNRDPRIMVKREPGEVNGTFYRIYPEGMILNYDGNKEIKMAPARWGLNFNRNYPDDWAKEETQRGSGPYPLSEPETRAIVDFIVSHPNIGLAVTYHTHGGVLLGYSESDRIPLQDRKLFKILELIFVMETGYPSQSAHSRPGPRPVPGGSFSTYMTVHRGIPCLTIETWDLDGIIGMGNFVERGGFEPRGVSEEEQALRLMEWNEREFGGNAFIDWKEFDHQQLGRVEIGGWQKKFLWRNPPDKFLEREINKVMNYPIKMAELLPKLNIIENLEKIDSNTYKTTILIQNEGALPTYTMKHAREIESSKPMEVQIELGEGMSLLQGKILEKMDLEGYIFREITEPRNERENVADKYKKTLVWIVNAKKPGKIKININGQRAGSKQVTLDINP